LISLYLNISFERRVVNIASCDGGDWFVVVCWRAGKTVLFESKAAAGKVQCTKILDQYDSNVYVIFVVE
jgi:hypothetical protein